MESVDDVWDAWKLLFFQAAERNIPSKQLKPQRNAPWLKIYGNSGGGSADYGNKLNPLGTPLMG